MTTEPQPGTDTPAADEAEAPPVPAGDDVRTGPEESDEPEAGAAEPAD